jgi:hypothetical protein
MGKKTSQKSDDNLSEFNVGDRVRVLSMARVRWEITRYSITVAFVTGVPISIGDGAILTCSVVGRFF